jgi:tetrapyrrole methylase family protein/MazG family protein
VSKPILTILGLGAGSADDITVGTVKRLLDYNARGKPLLLRTARHPSVASLEADGIVFNRNFDAIYESQETFENVYAAIVKDVFASVREHGEVAYIVPGHPLMGERTVQLLLQNKDDIEITVHSSISFIDACLTASRQEASGIVVLDALTLPDPTDCFRRLPDPFITNLPQLIFQVYDRDVASRVKIALLEQYPPEHEVTLVNGAGMAGEERVESVQLHRVDHSSLTFNHLTTLFVPSIATESLSRFSTLLDIMAQLRHPTKGCPWDREQSSHTLKRYAVEEVYEVFDAIDDGDVDKYIEELGDLLLQVVFHAQLARETGEFSIEDVLQSIDEKLIRRHPHVFGETVVSDSAEVLANWEMIKRAEKGNESRKSRLDGVPRQLPALSQAMEISKRAAKAGFEWNNIDGVFAKVDEEINELKVALANGHLDEVAFELGDLLFTVVNVARFAKVDAEDALRVMVRRFGTRFRAMENASDVPLEQLDQSSLEVLWQSAKREESS